jgi:hypothetical protein
MLDELIISEKRIQILGLSYLLEITWKKEHVSDF